jgi:hypothetical protein
VAGAAKLFFFMSVSAAARDKGGGALQPLLTQALTNIPGKK